MKPLFSIMKSMMWLIAGAALAATADTAYQSITKRRESAGETVTPPEKPVIKPEPGTWSDNELTVGYLGGAGVIMNLYGTRILLDPDQNSVLLPDEIGPVDLLFSSHLTNGRVDQSAAYCHEGTLFTSVSTEQGEGAVTIQPSKKYPFAGLQLMGTKVEHRGENPWGMDAAGLIVKQNKKQVWYASDSAYMTSFKQLRFAGKKELAIVPVGFGNSSLHSRPEDAWRMFTDSASARLIVLVEKEETAVELKREFNMLAGSQFDAITFLTKGETYRSAEA